MFGCDLKKIIYFSFMKKKSRGRLNMARTVFLWTSEAQFLLFFPVSFLTYDFHP